MKTISGNIRCFTRIGTFLQFKKREKHSRRSVTFSANACNFTGSNTAQWIFLLLPNHAKHHMFILCETDFFSNDFCHCVSTVCVQVPDIVEHIIGLEFVEWGVSISSKASQIRVCSCIHVLLFVFGDRKCQNTANNPFVFPTFYFKPIQREMLKMVIGII